MGGAMAFLDHGLPEDIAGGTLSSAVVAWKFKRGDEELDFEWDIGHELVVLREGAVIASRQVGDPAKATTSRRTVENEIRDFLRASSGQARRRRAPGACG
jgi:hypothetical protein